VKKKRSVKMETTVESISQKKSTAYVPAERMSQSSTGLTLMQRYDRFIEGLKFSHFGLISMAILFGSCLGSIAAMCVFYNGAPIWVFAIGLFASMANLVACIGQAPTKWVVNIFVLSVLVNLALCIIYPVL
jgi:hypothetical protein